MHRPLDGLTHSLLDHTEVADQQPGHLGRNIGRYNTRPDNHAAGGPRSSPLLVDMDCWHLRCNSRYVMSATFRAREGGVTNASS